MSLMGLGFGSNGHGYCHMCASPSCHHILGGQQQAMNQYNQMLRQYGSQQQQQQSISLASPGTISVSNGTSTNIVIAGNNNQPKLNKKLLLLRRA